MAKIRFVKPTTGEQQRIAAILTSLDNAIEATRALIEKQQQTKAGLMQALFTRGIQADGALRRPPVDRPKGWQQSATEPLPDEWRLAQLNDVIKIIDCRHVTPRYVPEGFPVVRPRNIKIDGIDFRDIEYVTERDFLHLTEPHVPTAGDIVFSRNASFGVPAYVEAGTPPFAIGQDVVVMTRKSASTKFIFYALQSTSIARQIEVKSAGSTFARINLADIRCLLVGLPSVAEQEAIALRLTKVDEVLAVMVLQLRKLLALKQGLMEDLLIGTVRVPPATEHAAA